MQDCEVCDGNGRYEVINRRTEMIEYMDCMDCMLHEQYRYHLMTELAKLFTSASHEKMCYLLAELLVNGVDNNKHDDLERLDDFIHKKNIHSLLSLAEAYVK